MTNQEVISLTAAGLNKNIIINKISTSKSKFDLSTDSLIQLKKAGVADEVVTAMLQAKTGATTGTVTVSTTTKGDPNDPMSPHGFGLYLYEEKNGEKKMTKLTPNVSAQNRTGGTWTSSMTYGIGKGCRQTKRNYKKNG